MRPQLFQQLFPYPLHPRATWRESNPSPSMSTIKLLLLQKRHMNHNLNPNNLILLVNFIIINLIQNWDKKLWKTFFGHFIKRIVVSRPLIFGSTDASFKMASGRLVFLVNVIIAHCIIHISTTIHSFGHCKALLIGHHFQWNNSKAIWKWKQKQLNLLDIHLIQC